MILCALAFRFGPPNTPTCHRSRRTRCSASNARSAITRIALNLISRWAYFTDLGKKWSRVPRATVLPNARERLNALVNADVKAVGLITPEEDVQHALRPDASMSLAQRLEQFLGTGGDPAWRAARLTSLEMRVPGTSATAHVDYQRSVVRTTDPIPLRTFALICARYLAGLGEDEVSALEAQFDKHA